VPNSIRAVTVTIISW